MYLDDLFIQFKNRICKSTQVCPLRLVFRFDQGLKLTDYFRVELRIYLAGSSC